MEPRDVRVLMLHAQCHIQLYINVNRIGVDNTTSFHLSHHPQFFAGGACGAPTITEFQHSEVEDRTLASLPREYSNCDFRAVVKVTFMRNSEEYSLDFSTGFTIGSGSATDETN